MIVRYELPRSGIGWELTGPRPSTFLRDEVVTLLCAALRQWAQTVHPDALVTRSLPVHWDRERPSYGVDPCVALFARRPSGTHLQRVCTWLDGHSPPVFALEVVNVVHEAERKKDYALVPDMYAASGTRELVIFDPLLDGPNVYGGPFRLQVWRRQPDGAFGRVYAGHESSYSEELGAHLLLRDEGRRLRFGDDPAGKRVWPTAEEAHRLGVE